MRHARELRPKSVVLDPMVGSGMVVRYAAAHGHEGFGFDIDPLAVLMSRVWTTPLDVDALRRRACDVVETARGLQRSDLGQDADTREYLAYWFGAAQREAIARLATVMRRKRGPIGDALKLALSRIIITKERGASLARDVSHSRPHRVADSSPYDVFTGYIRSVEQLAQRLELEPPPGNVTVMAGDARQLPLPDGSVDAVITSPPYLNAIDYLRGHRMALVWLGHETRELRALRAESIGSERGLDHGADALAARRLAERLGAVDRLPDRHTSMVLRYTLDMLAVMKQIARVIRSDARVTLVIGNSEIQGVFLRNDRMLAACAREAGLRETSCRERPLPPSRRYLPPPGIRSGSLLRQRMRTEVVMRLRLA